MSSSEISVSNEASSFSVTSTLASGLRISASRSNKENLYDSKLSDNEAEVAFMKAQTS